MPNGKMNAIQVQDAIVAEQRTLSPGLKLFGQALVEATHRAGAGGDAHQFLSDVPHFMSTGATDKHLR